MSWVEFKETKYESQQETKYESQQLQRVEKATTNNHSLQTTNVYRQTSPAHSSTIQQIVFFLLNIYLVVSSMVLGLSVLTAESLHQPDHVTGCPLHHTHLSSRLLHGPRALRTHSRVAPSA